VALSQALAQAGLAASQLDMLVPHQVNLHIIRDVGHRLGIPAERTWVNLEQVGNTSAASIPLALDAMWEQGRLHDDMLLGLTSFGAGFTWAAAVVRWGL
jgi:3-oxoacyl-[acyl-carrier-protein] synthase-3